MWLRRALQRAEARGARQGRRCTLRAVMRRCANAVTVYPQSIWYVLHPLFRRSTIRELMNVLRNVTLDIMSSLIYLLLTWDRMRSL
jgi:hypothetical protein